MLRRKNFGTETAKSPYTEAAHRVLPIPHVVMIRATEDEAEERLQWRLRPFEHDGIKVRLGDRMRQPQLSVPEGDVLFAGQLLQSDRTFGMEPGAAQSDVAAESKPFRIVET